MIFNQRNTRRISINRNSNGAITLRYLHINKIKQIEENRNQQPVLSSIMVVVLNIQCTSELSEALIKNVHLWASCPIGATIMVYVWSLRCVFVTSLKVLLMQVAFLIIFQKSLTRCFSFNRSNIRSYCLRIICLKLRHLTLQHYE